MNFSNNQKNVIELINGDLLVSASAGSGKTAVLVQRIINLILNHNVSINEVLVITFTNAAAVEMKERIIKALEDSINDGNKHILEEQLMLINNSNIQTFHSFCLDILKNNYYKLNLGSKFKIIKDNQRKMLIDEVLDDTLNFYYENEDEDFLTIVNIYGGKYSDLKLREIIIYVYEFMQNIVNIGEFIKKSTDIYIIGDNDEIFSTKLGMVLRLRLIDRFTSYKNQLTDFLLGIRNDEKVYSIIENDIFIINSFLERLNNSYEDIYRYIYSFNFLRLPKSCDDYKEIRSELKDFIDYLKKSVFVVNEDILKSQISDLKSIVIKLFEIVCKFKENFTLGKLSENFIDFNDMEHLTIKLLNDGMICNNYRDKFKYIFIDEYQDTNYIQEYIINKIKNNHNVFMVGDIKQSIYGFRGAKVDLFRKKYKNFKKIDDIIFADVNENKILLYDNYRSRHEVIDFINFVFKNIMVNGVSNIEYTDEEYLNCAGNYETVKNNNENCEGEVTLSIVINDEKNSDFINEIEDLECNLIIEYINKLINSEDILHKIYDKSINKYRKIEYRDIVILVRNINGSYISKLLHEELGKNNIPSYFDGGDQFFDCIEVITILSLLKVINNPIDDIDILTVLKSEIFNFSNNDLAYIRIVNNDEYIYNNIKYILNLDYCVEDRVFLNDEFSITYDSFKILYDKCMFFVEKISEYREKSLFMKIDEFIWFLYKDSKYYFLLSTMEDGLSKQSNLRTIFNKAKEFRISSFSGLFNFIEYLKYSKRFGDDTLVPKNISENENVVRIMSIHKSKGLEFPVVILCNTSGKFNFKDLSNPIILHDEFGIGLNHIDYDLNLETDMFIKNIMKEDHRDSIVSEELRILYVALTRAKEKLFITGTYNSDRDFQRIVNIHKCRSYLDFLCNSLMKHRDGYILREYIGESGLYDDSNMCEFKINVYNKSNFFKDKKDDNESEDINLESIIDSDPSSYSYINDIFNFKYKYDDAINMPVNLSVSEILSYDKEEKLDINFKVPKFIDDRKNEKVYTALDIGNLYHFFMQNIVLGSSITYDYLESEINRMIQCEMLSNDDVKHLNLNKILKFFEGNLGKRIIECFNKDRRKVYREFEFLMNHRVDKINENNDLRIQGIIDLFFFEGDNIILIDYKTDKRIFDNKVIPHRYKEQLYYYKTALNKIFNLDVSESYIYSFENNEAFMV